jgi:hypothetical protein
MHYGFIRSTAGFIKKNRYLSDVWQGHHDPLVEQLENEGPKAMNNRYPIETCPTYAGTHPSFAWQWLNDRGHKFA